MCSDGQVSATTVTVYNSGRQFEPDGDIRDITGIAYVPNPEEPGQLIVDLERQDPVNPPPGDCECHVSKKQNLKLLKIIFARNPNQRFT